METNMINTPDSRPNDRYKEFEHGIIEKFMALVDRNTPVFTTDAQNLWELYLNNLAEDGRQHYNCNCCRHFIERFGGLVVLTADGTLESILWSEDVPPFFKKSVDALRKAVNKARITGVFLTDVKNLTLGNAVTGEWTHMHVRVPRDFGIVNTSRLKDAYQMMAEKSEEYKMLNRALQNYSLDTVNQAIALLQTEAVYRGEKVLGVATWFKRLHDDRNKGANSRIKENITWMYVAKAPTGFCHVNSSMIGTLLDDITAGLDADTVARNFAHKMGTHMRSQTAPTAGGIAQAEKVIEKLGEGVRKALDRRYAGIDEVPYFIWRNNYIAKTSVAEAKSGGVFGHLAPRDKVEKAPIAMNLPTTTMTYEKFLRTVLPTAENLEVLIDNPNRLMALVTAVHDDAENILQWNNTMSWYYHGGIDAEIKKRVESAGGKYENNEIRCSLIWEGPTDLDLHCETPYGDHIYYPQSSRRDRFGGYLDVDANGMDRHTNTPVENMRWATNAPEGRYRFFVHNYNERTHMSGTPFRVELDINGKTFHFEGKPLANRREVTVFEFDYRRGQVPALSNATSSTADDWSVETNSFVKVNGITTSPNMWGENPVATAGQHVFFLLDGCRDLSEGKGRGFFNEMLKSDLREIRKTLELFTANAPIANAENATACGVGFIKDREWNLILRVTAGGSTRLIKIDRMD